MPEMDLTQDPLLIDMLTYLVWPNDKEKRNAYIVYNNERSVGWVKESNQKASEPFNAALDSSTTEIFESRWKNWEAIWTDREQLRSVIDLGLGMSQLEKEINQSVKRMFLVGMVALSLETMIRHHSDDVRLRGGPGIHKAREIVGFLEGCSTQTIENYWREYRSVSHYLAAIIALRGESVNAFAESLVQLHELPDIIIYSEYYRRVLTSYKSHGDQDTKLSNDEMWTLPCDWQIPLVSVEVSPLPEKVLIFLSESKAEDR